MQPGAKLQAYLGVHAVRGALSGHHALQHVEGRLVCLVGDTRGSSVQGRSCPPRRPCELRNCIGASRQTQNCRTSSAETPRLRQSWQSMAAQTSSRLSCSSSASCRATSRFAAPACAPQQRLHLRPRVPVVPALRADHPAPLEGLHPPPHALRHLLLGESRGGRVMAPPSSLIGSQSFRS